VQARHVYVFAEAVKAGWPGPWTQAARHAADFVVERQAGPDGLLRAKVTADGEVIDATPWIYDQAFGLLALASAQGLWPETGRWRAQAVQLRGALQTLRNRSGGFREAGPEPFQANCHMHMLEAALAWHAIDPAGGWGDLADEIVDMALSRFIAPQQPRIIEFFNEDWSPRRDADGLHLEPGHQFEWAWLLHGWQDQGRGTLPPRLVSDLLQAGLSGIGPHGTAVNRRDETGRIVDGAARLWPQTEWARAVLLLAPDDEASAVRALAAIGRFTQAAIPGLWVDHVDADGRPVPGRAPASSLYHLMGVALAAELRLGPQG
jgi:mannose/cellobiose epimerase-like protein (N-acyl-D-glucosamine 2-epimerase family)